MRFSILETLNGAFRKSVKKVLDFSKNNKSFKSQEKCQRSLRRSLEVLEDRVVPAVLQVNTLADTTGSGLLSLYDAIATVDVGNTNSLPLAEVQQVVGTLGQNDTIVFAPDLTGTMDITFLLPQVKKNLSIEGPGASLLTINGENKYEIIYAISTVDQLSFSDLTFLDCDGYSGGAIFAGNNTTATTLNVSNCNFVDDTAQDTVVGGGAISVNANCTLTATNCTFTDNTSPVGGAIGCFDGNLELNNDTFTGNTATNTPTGCFGGAVFTQNGLAAVSNSVFTNNSAGTYTNSQTLSDGGAIQAFGGSLSLTNDSFTGNSATDGGAVENNSSMSVVGCTFAGNLSENGGAIAVYNPADIENSTFAANSATLHGGALFSQTSTMQLMNDTIWGNSAAATEGGGLFIGSEASATLDNTIVAGNLGGSNTLDEISGSVNPNSSNNLIENSGTSGGLTNGTNSNLVGVAPMLSPLGNYGGPTETMVPAAGSPVIDAGSTIYLNSRETDQRGFSRTSGQYNNYVDIGAVEVQPSGIGTHLELQEPAVASIGTPMTANVTVLDDNGAPATGFNGPVVMSVASGPDNFTPSSTTTIDATYGTATFNNLAFNTSGIYTIRASFGNSVATSTLTVDGSLVFTTQPNDSYPADIYGAVHLPTIGVTFETLSQLNGQQVVASADDGTVTFQLFELEGSGSVPVSLNYGTNVPEIIETAANGVARINLPYELTGTYYVEATSGDSVAYSSDFSIIPGTPEKLVFLQQPGNATAGTPIGKFIVAVEDDWGNVVTNPTPSYSIKITPVGPGGFSAGASTESSAAGEAAFGNLVLGKTGTYYLKATTPGGLTYALSTTFNVNEADPIVGPTQSALAGSKYDLPFTAQVTTLAGSPIRSAAVTFTAPVTGASGAFGGKRSVTVLTNGEGIATAPAFTANSKAGSFNMTVSFGVLAASETISLTNLAGPPAHLLLSRSQSALVGDAYTHPLTATVTDAFGNPVSGIAVTFMVPASGASGTFGLKKKVTVFTNADGVAIAPTFTANTTNGEFLVDVIAPGLPTGYIRLTNMS